MTASFPPMTEEKAQAIKKIRFDSLSNKLRDILKANDIKEGSKTAQSVEFYFIQGAITADQSILTDLPAVAICLMSGRSILTL